jgi:hypothetical protein
MDFTGFHAVAGEERIAGFLTILHFIILKKFPGNALSHCYNYLI